MLSFASNATRRQSCRAMERQSPKAIKSRDKGLKTRNFPKFASKYTQIWREREREKVERTRKRKNLWEHGMTETYLNVLASGVYRQNNRLCERACVSACRLAVPVLTGFFRLSKMWSRQISNQRYFNRRCTAASTYVFSHQMNSL